MLLLMQDSQFGVKEGNTQFGNYSQYTIASFQETKLMYVIDNRHWFSFLVELS